MSSKGGIPHRFLSKVLNSVDWVNFVSGTTRLKLTQGGMQRITLPLPPLAEQRRIVAKLDALTARLARARAELERVGQLATNLRQRAVEAAFDGSLTAKWRAAAGGTSDKHKAAIGRQPGSAERRKPAAQIDWRPSFDLPAAWQWASVDSVISGASYGTSAKTSELADAVPVLRMGNLQAGEIDWSNLKYLPGSHPDLRDLLLESGDILFNRTNSFELVGKTAIFRGYEKPVSFASYLIRLRANGMLPILLVRYLNSTYARQWVERVASQQVGQANVNGSKLKALGIPRPPEAEQTEIAHRLEAAFARVDRFEAEAARARALLDRLEAALLTKAFRGELVPQDPADEPASVLLDRIRAERDAAPKVKRGRRGASPTKAHV